MSSSEARWAEVDAEFVVVLKVWPKNGPKAMFTGTDATWWNGRRVYQLDLPPSLRDWAKQEADAGRLKFGKRIPDDRYEAIHAEALAARS